MAYRVNIFDKSLMVNGNNGQVFSKNPTPDQTSFQVDPAGFTPSGYGFNPSTNYRSRSADPDQERRIGAG